MGHCLVTETGRTANLQFIDWIYQPRKSSSPRRTRRNTKKHEENQCAAEACRGHRVHPEGDCPIIDSELNNFVFFVVQLPNLGSMERHRNQWPST
jgi:hypothetical protein